MERLESSLRKQVEDGTPKMDGRVMLYEEDFSKVIQVGQKGYEFLHEVGFCEFVCGVIDCT